MIARVKRDGNYLESIDIKGRRIARAYHKGDLLGNSNEIVAVQDGNYIEIFDGDLKRISRTYLKFEFFLAASGYSFSIQVGNYAETYNGDGKRLNRSY